MTFIKRADVGIHVICLKRNKKQHTKMSDSKAAIFASGHCKKCILIANIVFHDKHLKDKEWAEIDEWG